MDDQIYSYFGGENADSTALYQEFPYQTSFYSTNEATFMSGPMVSGNPYVSSSPEVANRVPAPGKSKRPKRAKNSQSGQPTTFVNASITNFRALVQQHTGCHTNASTPRGPITLCFEPSSPPSTAGFSPRRRF